VCQPDRRHSLDWRNQGEKVTVAVDPGIVVNPMQLKRQVEGGTVMGVSIALLEELLLTRAASPAAIGGRTQS
jgi:CO/xanthine dehydrogenase Mo-binding subunit